MGLKKDQKLAACFSLLLLTMLLHLQFTIYPCRVDASNENTHKSRSFKPAAAATSNNKIKKGFFGKVDGEDEIFGSDKRKVNTGPNPLHNR
ncbi:hypothetical protein DCAR_0625776 [Daucus carota subsp. sativus]|nr:hypothetical protein DCAR_0625776 [Daucus carota subsp. sativus]